MNDGRIVVRDGYKDTMDESRIGGLAAREI